ncbi:MAG TPA: VOC family protein [Candidatus Dormibacteraeota bacterium]|jgi:catechol 2,3-dioxygenase-like lactoylglutathione lyase family enzyme|nr:VOC family protein [Candidatus Dormibacteraeota bacterium]
MTSALRSLLLCALCILCVETASDANAQTSARPKITGIASVRLFATDLHASRAFYSKILGFDSATSTCLGVTNPCYAVNGRQRVELQQIAGGTPENLLAEIAFSTPNLSEMREYLLAHKIEASPITKDETSTPHFTFKDPEGHPLAFVQQSGERFYTPAPHQVSARILHAGFIVKDLEKERAFYEGLLGFRLYWHGAFPPAERPASATNEDDWYEIQVPDGEEWIEFMLNISSRADKQERGVQNHFSLGVKNANNAAQHLRVNGATKFDGPEVGRDGKNSLDIYDPDLSRIEVMDFNSTKDPCCHVYTASHPKP